MKRTEDGYETGGVHGSSPELWASPSGGGSKVGEKLFDYCLKGHEGTFVGSRPRTFSHEAASAMLSVLRARCGAPAVQRMTGAAPRGIVQVTLALDSPTHLVSPWLLKKGRIDGVRTLSSRATEEAKMAKWNIAKTQANYVELSPMSFLKRVERVYPDYTSIIHGTKSFTWKQTCERCRRLASALTRRGISRGDTVAVVASNTPEMNECHFGIPMSGAVILAINTRLDAAAVAFSLEHSEAAFLITDTEFAPMVREALKLIQRPIPVIDICDSEMPHYNTADQRLSDTDYEQLLEEGDVEFEMKGPRDEWDPIALGYTSGTTGNPKGVVTHHRGAYLNAMSNIVGWDLGHHPRYLWTLPMFHCNGWCFPWTLAAVGGTSICLRKVTAEGMFRAIAVEGATHMCGAPIVLNTLRNAPAEVRLDFSHTVKVMTAAAPPPPSTLQAMQELGFHVTHVYGLTETYGPAVICSWHGAWDALAIDEQAKLRSRQVYNMYVCI